MSQVLLRALAAGKGKPAGLAGMAGRYGSQTENLQNSLLNLIGGNQVELGGFREKASRMAASPEALAAIRFGIPAAAVAAPAINFAENESYANQAMDLLAMGGAAGGTLYGLHNRGRVGTSTAALPPVNRNLGTAAVVGAGLAGLAGSDIIQSLIGGGRG